MFLNRDAMNNKSKAFDFKPKSRNLKSIQCVEDGEFHKRYKLGQQVMPSGHHDMEIRYAVRYSDQQTVVVKLRFKPNCFDSRTEEKEWRAGTQFMLNLPANQGFARMSEVLEDSNTLYIVTEKASGMDLCEILASGHSFTVNTASEILYELLKALAHLHEHNGIHKDMKLENVVVDLSGMSLNPTREHCNPKSVKIVDFDTVEEWSPQSPLSKDVTGTDQYISQEAYKGQYSPRSDIFALGVIVYRLVAGRFPFKDTIFDDKPGENWVGSPKMKEIQDKLQEFEVCFEYSVFKNHPDAADLLSRMLRFDDLQRPTAKEALESKWMKNRSSIAANPMRRPPSDKAKAGGHQSLFTKEVSCLPWVGIKDKVMGS